MTDMKYWATAQTAPDGGSMPFQCDANGNLKTALSGAITAGETHIGEVGTPVDIIEVTFVSDTSILADGDVITSTASIAAALRVSGGRSLLQSVIVHDEDDQGVALDIVFFRATQSLGTVNSAPSISDANARDIIGIVSVAAADYIDLGGNRIATLRNVGLLLEATTGTTIFASLISRGGTPTYTASGLKIGFGLIQS